MRNCFRRKESTKHCTIVILRIYKRPPGLLAAFEGERQMEFHKRMQASMLIVIIVCMMCVSTVLAREERLARAGEEQNSGLYITCGAEDSEPDM